MTRTRISRYSLGTSRPSTEQSITVRQDLRTGPEILDHRQWIPADEVRLYATLTPNAIEDLRDGYALNCVGADGMHIWHPEVENGNITLPSLGRLLDITLDQILASMENANLADSI